MNPLRKALPILSVILGTGGALMILGTIASPIGWMHLSDSYIAPGSALLIGAMTTAVAQFGLETVADKKAAAVDATTRQNRSRVYEELLGHIVESFTPHEKTLSEAQARAKAVSWAGPEAYEALTDWFRYAAAQLFVYATSASAELLIRHELVFRVAARMRRDLQVEELNRTQLLSLIFDDFDPKTVFPLAITDGRVDGKGLFVLADKPTLADDKG